MDILLLGEFSGLYKNLNEGLKILGHNSKVMATENGWRQIKPDIMLSSPPDSLIGKLKYRYSMYQSISRIENYDIVQLINPLIIPFKFFPRYKVINKLIKNNTKFFLSVAGDDSFYWKYGRQKLRYGPFEDTLKYDSKSDKAWFELSDRFAFNRYIADKCTGIIPIAYEYEVSYQDHINLRRTIPMPINTDEIQYVPNRAENKIIIFHGLNRYGFKGTRFVESAFEILRKKYPNDLELIIDGKMPLNVYLDVMKRANVIIDQTFSYSCGMNALYAMAMGKIVMGGAEPESLTALGVKETPVINILPDVTDIVKKVEWILENRNRIEEIGYASRLFVENVHHYIKVAQQYVDVWNE